MTHEPAGYGAGCDEAGADGAGKIVSGTLEGLMRRIIIASMVAVLPTCVAAAELPRKTTAPPPDVKVKACAAYGAGFVKVEGSTTCIKVGGSISVEGGRSR
jgi:Porin subfamily